MPVESAAVEHVARSCFILTDYPVLGFVFELQTDTVQLVKVMINRDRINLCYIYYIVSIFGNHRKGIMITEFMIITVFFSFLPTKKRQKT